MCQTCNFECLTLKCSARRYSQSLSIVVSFDPCCLSSKKLSWLNFCTAFVDWKLISTLRNDKRIFCLVMIRSFLNLVPIMRIGNRRRISQSLSVLISHDPCCYLSSKKSFSWFHRQQNQFSTLRNDKPAFHLLIMQSFLNFPSIWLKFLKFESFSFFSWIFKGTTEICQIISFQYLRHIATRTRQSLSIPASRDPYCYLWVKKPPWFNFLLGF